MGGDGAAGSAGTVAGASVRGLRASPGGTLAEGCVWGAREVFGFGDGGRAARRGWGCDCRARRPISGESDDEAAAGRR